VYGFANFSLRFRAWAVLANVVRSFICEFILLTASISFWALVTVKTFVDGSTCYGTYTESH